MVGMEAGLPAGLADMPPGPGLSTVLATVDRTRLSAAQLAILAAARARQIAHDQAGLLADAVALAAIPWHGPGRGTREQEDDFAADQVAFALTMSRWGAHKLLNLGEILLHKLPMVYEALAAGRIDYPRAAVYASELWLLDADQARRIATDTLAKAPTWTPSQLRDRLKYRAHKADPSLIKRRHTQSVTDRRVHVGLDTEGTAQLTGRNLPPDRAAAADNWIDRLARAAKADGDTRTLEQLRADAMLDLLAGLTFQLHPSTDPLTTAADTGNEPVGAGANGAGTPAASQTKVNAGLHADAAATERSELDTRDVVRWHRHPPDLDPWHQHPPDLDPWDRDPPECGPPDLGPPGRDPPEPSYDEPAR